MDGQIQKFILLLILPVIIHCKNTCPSSTCGNSSFLHIKYPFKLQTDQSPKNCRDYMTIRCNEKGQAVINLSSGDFYVTSIQYYMEKIISLSDPGNCTLGRLMKNYPWYPLVPIISEDYMYYACPRRRVESEFLEIHCLSNPTNITTATRGYSPQVMEGMFGCKPILSSLIPVTRTSEVNSLGNLNNLQLTWNAPVCDDCEGDEGNEKPGKSGWAKLFGSPVFTPSAVILAFFGAACFLRLIKLTADTVNANNNSSANSLTPSPNAAPAVAAPPQNTGESTTDRAVGSTENSKDKTCTEFAVQVLSESQGTSMTNPNGLGCSICLEECYGNHDRVKIMPHCGHCFHAECIDLWLQKNKTCPVCRNSISK